MHQQPPAAIGRRLRAWYLEDVEETHRQHSLTFRIPSLVERMALRPGASVRLHFTLDSPAANGCLVERMSVTITHADGKGGFRGELDNEPVYTPGVSIQGEVTFHARNVARVMIPRDDPRWIDTGLLALATLRALKTGSIGFARRGKPHNAQDSGWAMYHGDEGRACCRDPSSYRKVSLDLLLEIEPALKEVLARPRGGYERTGAGSFVRSSRL
jgi:hypothetical protein